MEVNDCICSSKYMHIFNFKYNFIFTIHCYLVICPT